MRSASLMLVVLVVGCNAPSVVTTSLSADADSSSPVTVDAVELLKAYRNDQTSADQLYRERMVRVVGTVQSVNQAEVPWVIRLDGIDAYMRVGQEVASRQLKPGQPVELLGFCSGRQEAGGSSHGFLITLNDCVVSTDKK